MSKLPEIRIKDAWLFRLEVSEHLNELWGDGKPLRSDDEYAEIVKTYREAWARYEQKILVGMTEVIGLAFRQNIIDVYIAPWIHAFSEPLIIGVVFEPHKFIDILTHELIHRLLIDNTALPYDTYLLPSWEKLFGNQHSNTTIVHIPVHAIHKAIYLDVLKAPERLERDLVDNKEHGAIDYVKAWDYVEKQGYRHIIEQLKQSYKDLRQFS